MEGKPFPKTNFLFFNVQVFDAGRSSKEAELITGRLDMHVRNDMYYGRRRRATRLGVGGMKASLWTANSVVRE